MSLNGSGVFVVNSTGQPVVAGTLISASVFNAFTADVAAALSAALYKDGQQTVTANLPMGGYRHTGVAAATARTDYTRVAEAQDGTYTYLTSVAGTNTITATAPVSMTAYATGQKFRFIAANTNTGAVTLNINSIGAKNLKGVGVITLAGGEILSGAIVECFYDGTQFQATTIHSFLQSGTGAVATTAQRKGREQVSVFDFMTSAEIADVQAGTALVDVATAFNAALDSGAKKVKVPKGTYLVSASLTMASGQILEGDGEQDTIIKASGTITVFPLTAGREIIRDLSVHGPSSTPASYAGIGIEVGTSTDWTAHVVLERVTAKYFTRGLSIKAALWFTCIQGRFQFNTYGCDFNAGAGKYSTTVTFIDTKFANNEYNGVGATAAPVSNKTITFQGGSVENNGLAAPATYPQMVFTSCGGLTLDNVYFESAGTGGYPDAVNLTGVNNATVINPYINGSDEGFVSSSAQCNNLSFINPQFVNTQTRCFNLPACVDILVFHPVEDVSADVLTGSTSTKIDYKIAQLPTQAGSFTPAITGSSGTSAHTYVWQVGRYTQIGNVIFFSGAVRISAKDAGMTGNATITGLPTASLNVSAAYTNCKIDCENVTTAANKNGFVGIIDPNTTTILLYEQSSTGAALSALPSASITATTIIYFSGHYLVTAV